MTKKETNDTSGLFNKEVKFTGQGHKLQYRKLEDRTYFGKCVAKSTAGFWIQFTEDNNIYNARHGTRGQEENESLDLQYGSPQERNM